MISGISTWNYIERRLNRSGGSSSASDNRLRFQIGAALSDSATVNSTTTYANATKLANKTIEVWMEGTLLKSGDGYTFVSGTGTITWSPAAVANDDVLILIFT